MAPLALLTFVLLAGSACSAPQADRIVGGEPTTIDQYPSIVQVESRGVFSGEWAQSCASNILNNVYVLSAAHCFAGLFYSPANRRIRAGTTDREEGGFLVYVEREINHPIYGSNGYDADISVVRLQTPITFNPVVQPGTIASSNTVLPDGLPVIHAGWGTTQWLGATSPVLRDVTIFTVNRELCAARYLTLPRPQVVTENMICAGILDVGGKDACQGDSGGPLYYRDPQQGLVLVGIVSWGEQCAHATFPGVSTRVASYTNWIIQTAV